MDREAIEQLAEHIKKDGAGVVEVLGIEHLGSPGRGLWVNGYFVKCVYKRNE